MSVLMNRETLSHLVIIIAVCVGGWLMLVEPKVREVRKLDAHIAEVSSGSIPINEQAVQQMADRVSALRLRVAEIGVRNDIAGDSSQLFGLIMQFARDHEVTVVNLNPGSQSTPVEGQMVGIMDIDMALEGTYENIATFVDRLQQEASFVRPTALRMTPMERGEQALVAARLGCQSLSFSLPPQVAALQGMSNGRE